MDNKADINKELMSLASFDAIVAWDVKMDKSDKDPTFRVQNLSIAHHSLNRCNGFFVAVDRNPQGFSPSCTVGCKAQQQKRSFSNGPAVRQGRPGRIFQRIYSLSHSALRCFTDCLQWSKKISDSIGFSHRYASIFTEAQNDRYVRLQSTPGET